jgi:hypothetical protein
MKQVRIIHDTGFPKEELENAWPIVYQNVFASMRSILDAMQTMGIDLAEEANRAHAETINCLTGEMSKHINKAYRQGCMVAGQSRTSC